MLKFLLKIRMKRFTNTQKSDIFHKKVSLKRIYDGVEGSFKAKGN